MILALDIATRMGFAFGEPGTTPESGSILFGSEGASDAARYHHAFCWAIDLFKTRNLPITTMTIEDQLDPQAFSNKHAAHMLYGLPAPIMAVAYECGVYDIVRRPVSDVRGLFINACRLKSDVAKARVMRRCKQLGWDVADHNAADACALWAYECSLIKGKARPILQQLAWCGL
jgi:hypothetical protein